MAVGKIPQVSTLRTPLALLHLFIIINNSPEETKTNNEFHLLTSIICVATAHLQYLTAVQKYEKHMRVLAFS